MTYQYAFVLKIMLCFSACLIVRTGSLEIPFLLTHCHNVGKPVLEISQQGSLHKDWLCRGYGPVLKWGPPGSWQLLFCEERVFLSHGPAGLPSLAATPVLSFSLHPARHLSQSDSSNWGHLQKLPPRSDKGTQNLA